MTEKRNWERNYVEMTEEELERRFREAFFYTDKIDETVYLELERLGAALEKKRHVDFPLTPEESWDRFSRLHAGEIARCCAQAAKTERAGKAGHYRSWVRSVLIAAVIAVLLAGAALAAGPLGLVSWAPRWNAAAGRYEPAAEEAGEKPIPAALQDLGINEPVYPARLPEGFVITESHISVEPLMMIEQYARGNERLSITVTPISGVKSAVYQKSGVAVRELRGGLKAHFVFENEETVTAICFTKNYATFISGNLPVEEITEIIYSIEAEPEGGGKS